MSASHHQWLPHRGDRCVWVCRNQHPLNPSKNIKYIRCPQHGTARHGTAPLWHTGCTLPSCTRMNGRVLPLMWRSDVQASMLALLWCSAIKPTRSIPITNPWIGFYQSCYHLGRFHLVHQIKIRPITGSSCSPLRVCVTELHAPANIGIGARDG